MGGNLRWSVLQYGTGYSSRWPCLGGLFWLAWSAGAVLCVDSDEALTEFEDGQTRDRIIRSTLDVCRYRCCTLWHSLVLFAKRLDVHWYVCRSRKIRLLRRVRDFVAAAERLIPSLSSTPPTSASSQTPTSLPPATTSTTLVWRQVYVSAPTFTHP